MKRLLAGESPQALSEGSTLLARFLRAVRMIADIEEPDSLWRATNAEQLNLVKAAWKKLHRVVNGGRTLPDNLYLTRRAERRARPIKSQ